MALTALIIQMHKYHLPQKYFITLNRRSIPIKPWASHLTSPQSLVTSHLFLSLSLLNPKYLYKWKRIIFILCCLAYFTSSVFTVHLCCSIHQTFIPLHDWVIFYGTDVMNWSLCPPRIYILKPSQPQSGFIWGEALWEVPRIRWGHKHRALVNGFSALLEVRRELHPSSAFCPWGPR